MIHGVHVNGANLDLTEHIQATLLEISRELNHKLSDARLLTNGPVRWELEPATENGGLDVYVTSS